MIKVKEIKRDIYLNKLIDRKENDMIKVITGIRRCGKSYLMDPIYKNYLLSTGVKEDHIIKLELDSVENEEYLDRHKLYKHIMGQIKDNKIYYILLDEIQKVDGFESVLNGFLRKKNLDVYVIGSSSKFLSSDIKTEFRGRGDEVRVYPLTFREYLPASSKNVDEALKEYITYGGMPYILSRKTDEEKSKYLNNLFNNTYINDIVERNNIQKDEVLESLIDVLASSVGSLTNPLKLENTFKSKDFKNVSAKTINTYIDYLIDAFMINKSLRYDIKGKKYINTPSKYYFTDIGLRNVRLNFRQQEDNHLMENIIYNELLVRGFNVDVGVVEYTMKDKNNKKMHKQLEVDFVCNKGSNRYYIQSAYSIPTKEKMEQEEKSLIKIDDFFKRIIIVENDIKLWRNEKGIVIMGLKQFLLDENSLDL